MIRRYFLAVPSGRGAPHHRHLYAVKFTSATAAWPANADAGNRAHHYQQQHRSKSIRRSVRNQPVCLSCDVGFMSKKQRPRERRDSGGKQNRMDEARDGRLRQQQRERWEHLQEEEENNKERAATAEGKTLP